MKTTLLPLLFLAVVSSGYSAACCSATHTDAANSTTLGPLRGDSLYQVTSRWTDDSGKERSLADGRGRIRIVGMFYSSCPNACPRLLEKLQKLDTSLPASVRDHVDIVLVSFDPQTDTPSALHTFRQSRNLTDPRWQLLSGTPASVRELAALLDIKFKKEANGTIAHSNVITVLDAEGSIAYQEPGLSSVDSKLAEKIAALANGVFAKL